jgi:prepilin-type N-terminal cleavage/methylation domain-containing protein
MSRLRAVRGDERGFTLVELLMVISLVVIVMSATLTAFAQFEQTTGTNQRQNESQDQVRVALAGVARELRNLASPTAELPEAIVRATGTDLIFQSVSSTITRRVRYCLDTTGRRLLRALDPAPFGDMPTSACPATASGWSTYRVVGEHVVNGARPVFAYNIEDPKGITEISSTLWVDVNPGERPLETSLQTSVFLRNQNRAPTASFTADRNGSSIVFNGAGSFDPEGRALRFFWYDPSVTNSDACPGLPAEVPQVGCVGTNLVATYTPATGGIHDVYLVVSDPAGLVDQADVQEVCIPTLEDSCAAP